MKLRPHPSTLLLIILTSISAAATDPLTAVVRSVAAERDDASEPDAALSSVPFAPTPPNISVLRPLHGAAGNPYLARLVAGARAYVSNPEPAADWPKVTRQNVADYFKLQGSSDRDSRGTGSRLEALLLLFANPESPMHHDPEVLRRFLRRAHAYVEGIEQTAAIGRLKAGQVLLDDFAIAPASGALREFAALYPDLLLPAQRAQWDRSMRLAADAMMGKAEGRSGRYANIDLALAVELLNFGLYLKDDRLLARSRELLHAQAANILPDGGVHYIWSQNESVGYHEVVAHFIARCYEITGDEVARDMLRRLEWFGPVSVGRRGEYWTAPSWKHTWNGGDFATGGEPVACITGNPYVRGMIIPPAAGAPLRGWESARNAVAWWRPDTASKALPDNYTVVDRNIAGPRAWYGRFNYAATLRGIPESEPGIATLVGAQVLRPDMGRGVLLMGVAPRVQIAPDRAQSKSFAYLTSGLRSHLAMGRTWAAFSAEYQPHVFGSSTKGILVPWRARQLWLTLPERLVGVLEIAPESPSTAKARIEALVRLGIGGTVSGPAQKLVARSKNSFEFGDLRVVVHSSDFARVDTELTPFRVPSAPFSDIVLRDVGPVSAVRHCVVEIRPAYVPDDATVLYDSAKGELNVKSGAKNFLVRRQLGAAPDPSPRVSVHVESPDAEDHAPAWPDFATLAAARAEKP